MHTAGLQMRHFEITSSKFQEFGRISWPLIILVLRSFSVFSKNDFENSKKNVTESTLNATKGKFYGSSLPKAYGLSLGSEVSSDFIVTTDALL
jgi:hypothetical protein